MFIRAAVAAGLLLIILPGTAALAQSAVTQADVNRIKTEISALKRNLQLKEAELQALELQMAQQTAKTAASAKPAMRTQAAPTAPVVVASAAIPGTAPPMPIARRANIDPSPYEASITARVGMFRMPLLPKWRVLDEKRVVYWVVDDEAYMLILAQACPGLLGAEKLKLENFSSKVRAGQDNVVFGDQACLIESIVKLGGHSLPKPPKS